MYYWITKRSLDSFNMPFKIIIRYTLIDANKMTDFGTELQATYMLREVEKELEIFFMRYKALYGNDLS